jgi:putative transposase
MAWIEITRSDIGKNGLRYASDATDAEWVVIEPNLPPQGVVRAHARDLHARCHQRYGLHCLASCQWCLLPKDFLTFTTVQRYFYT